MQYRLNEHFVNCSNCGIQITLSLKTLDELESCGLKPKCVKCLEVKN